MIRVLVVDDQELVRSGFRIILESEPDIEVVGEAANGAEAIKLAAALAPDVICMDVEMPVMNGIEASRQILAEARRAGAAGAGGTSILILTTFGHERYLFDALAAGVSGFLLKSSRAEQLIDAVHALASGQALLGPDVTRAVIERVSQERAAAEQNNADQTAAERAAAEGVAAYGRPRHTASGVSGQSRARRSAASTGEADGETVQSATSATATTTAATATTAATGLGSVGSSLPDANDTCDGSPDPLAEVGLTDRERDVLTLLAQGKSNSEIAAGLFLGEATVKTHVSNILQKLGVRDRIQAVVWAHTRGAG